MSSLISSNVLRLSDVRKNWNIRGIDITIQEDGQIALDVVKEETKTTFMMRDCYDVQLLTIDRCPQYASRDVKIQYVLLVKMNEKDIVLGSVDIMEDMILFCDIIVALVHQVAAQRGFYCDRFAQLFGFKSAPRLSFASPRAQCDFISAVALYVSRRFQFAGDVRPGRVLYYCQRVYYALLQYLATLLILCSANCISQQLVEPATYLDMVVTDGLQTPFALKGDTILVQVSGVLKSLRRSFQNRCEIVPALRPYHQHYYDLVDTFEKYLMHGVLGTNRGLVLTPRMLAFSYFPTPGPFIQLVQKSVLCYQASTLRLERVQEAYDRAWQVITGSPTARVRIDAALPPFAIMPLNNLNFPVIEEEHLPMFSGMIRILDASGALFAPMHIQYTDRLADYLQGVDGQLVNGSIAGFLIQAIGILVKERYVRDAFRLASLQLVSAPREEDVPAENRLRMYVCYSPTCDPVCKCAYLCMAAACDFDAKLFRITFYSCPAARASVLPEKPVAHEYTHVQRTRAAIDGGGEDEDLELFRLQMSKTSVESLTSGKYQRQFQKVRANDRKVVERTDTGYQVAKKYRLRDDEIHMGEIDELFVETEPWEETLTVYFLRLLVDQYRERMRQDLCRYIADQHVLALTDRIFHAYANRTPRLSSSRKAHSRSTSRLSVDSFGRRSTVDQVDEIRGEARSLLPDINLLAEGRRVHLALSELPPCARLQVLVEKLRPILERARRLDPRCETVNVRPWREGARPEQREKDAELPILRVGGAEPEPVLANAGQRLIEPMISHLEYTEYATLAELQPYCPGDASVELAEE